MYELIICNFVDFNSTSYYFFMVRVLADCFLHFWHVTKVEFGEQANFRKKPLNLGTLARPFLDSTGTMTRELFALPL